MNVRAIDHVVLYARDPEQIVRFYVDVLGMRHEVFEGDHHALHFGGCKINVHAARRPFEPHAEATVPGHLDICFTVAGPIESVVDELIHRDVRILEGPGRQVGANGPMTSVYFRDPEGNLVELASYHEGDRADLS